MQVEESIRAKYSVLEQSLNELSRRLWAATEATAIGYGGVSLVARATGMSRNSILAGQKQIESGVPVVGGRIRQPGGGRKTSVEHQPDLKVQLESLVDPLTRGDPESPLRWTVKSTRRLADALIAKGYRASERLVAGLLKGMGYSLQANRKTLEGKQHPDRNSQFEYINAKVSKELRLSQPVISVDTKKKELIGNYVNKGTEWRKAKSPRKVNGHDFPGPDIPKAHPYGIYELQRNIGFVNVGTDHDTAVFAVASIRLWWKKQGTKAYPKAKRLLITADAGGSNGARLRLWKWELQRFADEIGFPISVSHFPPGTSKWNKVEHRLFSFISSNWRGEPLEDFATVVNLIAKTTTSTGLKVACRLDTKKYQIGKTVSKAEWESITLEKDDFHGEWNYTIRPRKPK